MEPEKPASRRSQSPVSLEYATPQRVKPMLWLPITSVTSGLGILLLAVLNDSLHGGPDGPLMLLFAVVAVVTGALTLPRGRQSTPAERRLGIVGLLVGLIWLFAFFSSLSFMTTPIRHRHLTQCGSNLRQIALGVIMYATEHRDQFPDSLETVLLTQDISAHAFVCPACGDTPAMGATVEEIAGKLSAGPHLSYIYIGAGMNSQAATDETVIAYEPLSNHGGAGMNVLFGDAHVEWWERGRAEKLIAELEAGHNPPRGEKVK